MSACSIVVPCFNEAARFDAAAFEGFVRTNAFVDFVLVDDGSIDGTRQVLEALAAKAPARIRVLALERNQGKAEAVRQGMLAAMQSGCACAGYWDADLATPLEAIDDFVQTLERDPAIEMIFGARVALLGRRIERRASRHYFGRIFATAASTVLELPVYDTQCGAKLFRNSARTRALFETRFGSRWIFDVEILARYLRSAGAGGIYELPSGIYELPLDEWRDIGSSKVRASDFLRAVGEMAAIHRAYRLPGPMRSMLDLATHPMVQQLFAGAPGAALLYATFLALASAQLASPLIASSIGALLGAVANQALAAKTRDGSGRSSRRSGIAGLGVIALQLAINGAVMSQAGAHGFALQLVASALVFGVGLLFRARQRANAEPAQLAKPMPVKAV